MVEKTDLLKSQEKDSLPNLAEKIGLSVYGGNMRRYLCYGDLDEREF